MRELQAGDPQRIGPYRLVGRLGTGGMGGFSWPSVGGRLVAVKVIRAELAADPSSACGSAARSPPRGR